MITNFPFEVSSSTGELAPFCAHIVVECLYLARIGRLDVPWTVNRLARSVTKWNKGCDEKVARLESASIRQIKTDNTVALETTFRTAKLDYFRTRLLSEICKIPNQHQEEYYAYWDPFSLSWICKKQTAVSHSSAESVRIVFRRRFEKGGYARIVF